MSIKSLLDDEIREGERKGTYIRYCDSWNQITSTSAKILLLEVIRTEP